jgi:hypothetical protein
MLAGHGDVVVAFSDGRSMSKNYMNHLIELDKIPIILHISNKSRTTAGGRREAGVVAKRRGNV